MFYKMYQTFVVKNDMNKSTPKKYKILPQNLFKLTENVEFTYDLQQFGVFLKCICKLSL